MDFDPADVSAHLEAKATELRETIATLTAPAEEGSTIGFGKRIGDGTTQAISQMENAGSARLLSETLDQVVRAQAKLAEGSYGRCDECGEDIGEGRLEFRPWSTMCIKHASVRR